MLDLLRLFLPTHADLGPEDRRRDLSGSGVGRQREQRAANCRVRRGHADLDFLGVMLPQCMRGYLDDQTDIVLLDPDAGHALDQLACRRGRDVRGWSTCHLI